MHKLAEICVRRPVFAMVLVLVPAVFGVLGYSRLGVDWFPDVDFPVVIVTTVSPGTAPEEIETEITDKIEEAVNTVSGIDQLRSTSSESISYVAIVRTVFSEERFILQRINQRVFPRPELIMENMRLVTTHAHRRIEAEADHSDRIWQLPRVIPTKDGS